MQKRLMLIVNPASGKGQAKNALFSIVSLFNENGYTVTVYVSGKKHEPEQFARLHSKQYDLIVCVGGDGTFSNVVNGLMRTPLPPPVGYIPMGTANDLATSLGIPKKPLEAVRTIVRGHPVPMDVGGFGNRYFTYISAFGAFTEVSYSTPQESKRSLGHLAYVLEGLSSLTQITPRHTVVEHDNGVIEDNFVFGGVTNSTSVAGLVKLDAKDVGFRDGLFEVILVRNPMKISDLNDIVTHILTKNFHSNQVCLLHTQNVKFKFLNKVSWTLDGEDGGQHREIEIKNYKEAIRIIL